MVTHAVLMVPQDYFCTELLVTQDFLIHKTAIYTGLLVIQDYLLHRTTDYT